MTSSYTNVLKDQRVERRQTTYTVRGNTVLKNQRDFDMRRVNPPPYLPQRGARGGTHVSVLLSRQAPTEFARDADAANVHVADIFAAAVMGADAERQSQELWEEEFYKEHIRKTDVTDVKEDDAANIAGANIAGANIAGANIADVNFATSDSSSESSTVSIDSTYSAEGRAQVTPQARVTPSTSRWIRHGVDDAKNPEAVAEELSSKHGSRIVEKISPFVRGEFLIVLLAIGALGFFAYNALLWQSDLNLISPPQDANIRANMLDFAFGNGVNTNFNSESEVGGFISENMALNVSDRFEWQYYVVKFGDNVSKIAADHSISMDAVIASNNLKNARAIREGDRLRIPNMDGIPYTAIAGDSYEKIADKFGVALDAILDANDIRSRELLVGAQLFIPGAKMKSEELKAALGELFIFPISGKLSSSFGWRKDPFSGERRYHSAIDIAAKLGTPIKVSRDGKITTVGVSPVFGNYIIVSHSNGYQSLYAHLSAVSIKQGMNVIQGQKIGEVGSTGQSTGPHLHFAVYKNGRAINPLDLLKI